MAKQCRWRLTLILMAPITQKAELKTEGLNSRLLMIRKRRPGDLPVNALLFNQGSPEKTESAELGKFQLPPQFSSILIRYDLCSRLLSWALRSQGLSILICLYFKPNCAAKSAMLVMEVSTSTVRYR